MNQPYSSRCVFLLTYRQRYGFLSVLFVFLTTSDAVTLWAAYQRREPITATCSHATNQNKNQNVPQPSQGGHVLNHYHHQNLHRRSSRLFPRTRIAHPLSVDTDYYHHHHQDTTLSSVCKQFCTKVNDYRTTNCISILEEESTTKQDQDSSSSSSLLKIQIPRGGHVHPKTVIESTLAASSTTIITTPFNLPLNVWKIIFQGFLTAINVFFWYVPLKSKHMTDNKLVLSLANAFSGGVFLSLAFGHLIPECVSGFHTFHSHFEQATTTPSSSFWIQSILHNEALPYMLVLSGYLLIFFVEKIAFDAHEALHELEHAKDYHDTKIQRTSIPPLTPSSITTTSNIIQHSDASILHHQHDDDDHHQNQSNPIHPVTPSSSSSLTTSKLPITSTNTFPSPKVGMPVGRSALILLAALAVHSILEMTALGLADTFGDCSLLSLSIALHQPAESIALLVAFVKSGMPQKDIIKYLSIFSAMGPIGVAIGMAVNEFASPVVDSIMLAIVAGTFVYVGATEVIPEEWEHPEHKWIKFFALMTGIISIFTITQYTMSLDSLS